MKAKKLLNLPWHIVEDEPQQVVIGDPDYERVRDETRYMGHRIAKIGDWDGQQSNPNSPRAKARAEFIVRACNSHDALVAAGTALGKIAEQICTDYAPAQKLLRKLDDARMAWDTALKAAKEKKR